MNDPTLDERIRGAVRRTVERAPAPKPYPAERMGTAPGGPPARRTRVLVLAATAASIVALVAGSLWWAASDDSDRVDTAAGTTPVLEVRHGGTLAVTADGVMWVLESAADDLVLHAMGIDGGTDRIELDPGEAERPSGRQLVATGPGSVTVAHVVCADPDCDRAELSVERFRFDGERVERVAPAPERVPAAGDSAVVFVGLHPDGSAWFSVDWTLFRAGPERLEATEMPGSPVCVVGDELVATTDEEPGPAPDELDHEHLDRSVVAGALVVLRDGEWVPVVGSEHSHPFGEFLEPRCTTAGIELAEGNKPARRLWDGSGTWVDVAEPEVGWDFGGRQTWEGLLGAVGGEIVHVDTVTGTTTRFVPTDSWVQRWRQVRGAASSTAPRPPVGSVVEVSPAPHDHAVTCVRTSNAASAPQLCGFFERAP